MTPLTPLRSERLFEPFFDEIDGVLCLLADALEGDILDRCAHRRLRFPLVLDEKASLREQIEATTHAPASCRFGPFCDNILGMNWRLPTGKLLRVGERVVKSTTGYDWQRFLLHSGSRFGEPVDYVIRLRPEGGFTMVAYFQGTFPTLRLVVSQLLRSGWMHWWDAVDFLCEPGQHSVRVIVNCPEDEAGLFEEELRRVATMTATQLETRPGATTPRDGLPDVTLKTTASRAMDWALAIGSAPGSRCVALVYSGVLHIYLDGDGEKTERVRSLAEPLTEEIHALGGDWHSPHLPHAPANATESQWLTVLEKAIHA